MSTYTDCLKGAIGISKNECPCYNAGDLPEYSESASGLFMDDYLFGIPLSYPAAVSECDHNDLWLLMDESRRQGILRFISEFGRAVETAGRYRQKFSAYSNKVGGEKFTGAMPQDQFHVMQLCSLIPAASLLLNSVTVRATGQESQETNVLILTEQMMNADDIANPIATLTGTYSAAGVAICTSTGGAVRLNVSANEKLFVVVQSSELITPRNTKFERTESSGCCGRRTTITAGWATYIDAASYPVTSLSDHESAAKDTVFTNGIQLDVQFACDAYFLCEGMDFETDTFGRVVAELLVLYSNRQLFGYMLSSDKVNIYTAARSEELIEKDQMLVLEIDERLEWASANLPSTANDCYACYPRQRKRSNLI